GAAMLLPWLPPVPAILPLFGAGRALAMWRSKRAQLIISVVVLALVLAAALTLLLTVGDAPYVLDIGGWSAPVGINVVADRLAAPKPPGSSRVAPGGLLDSLAQGLGGGGGAP